MHNEEKNCEVCKRKVPEEYLLVLKKFVLVMGEKEITIDSDIIVCGIQCLNLALKVKIKKDYDREIRIKKILKYVKENGDPSIIHQLIWLNENGFITMLSCSGQARDHTPKKYPDCIPMIVFDLYHTRKNFHRPLTNAIKNINVFVSTFFMDKKKPYALYCIFSDPKKIISPLWSERNDQLAKYKYPDDVILEKINELINLLKDAKPNDDLTLEEYPYLTHISIVNESWLPKERNTITNQRYANPIRKLT